MGAFSYTNLVFSFQFSVFSSALCALFLWQGAALPTLIPHSEFRIPHLLFAGNPVKSKKPAHRAG